MIKEGLRLSRPEHALDPVYEVMQKCQNIEPDDRPTFQQLKQNFRKIAADYTLGLINHSFYTNLNSPEPRAAFANSLYFTPTNTDLPPSNVPLASEPASPAPSELLPQSSDGYLLPSPMARPHSYLQMVTSQ